jgi:hypothetical protein
MRPTQRYVQTDQASRDRETDDLVYREEENRQ